MFLNLFNLVSLIEEKTLCNNLMSALSIARESAESALNQLSLNAKVRAEELSSEQFELLYKVLSGYKTK